MMESGIFGKDVPHERARVKLEASKLPTGLCIARSTHGRGRRSDFEIIQSRL